MKDYFLFLDILQYSIKTNKCVYTSLRSVWFSINLFGLVANDCIPYLGYSSIGTDFSFLIKEKRCVLPGFKFNIFRLKKLNNSRSFTITNNKITAMLNIIKYGPIHAEINTFDDFYEKPFKNSAYEYEYGMFVKPLSLKVIGWDMTQPENAHWICMIPKGNGHDDDRGVIKIKFNTLNFDSYFIFGDLEISKSMIVNDKYIDK